MILTRVAQIMVIGWVLLLEAAQMELLGLPVAKMDFKPITTDTDPNGVCQVNILECFFSNQKS